MLRRAVAVLFALLMLAPFTAAAQEELSPPPPPPEVGPPPPTPPPEPPKGTYKYVPKPRERDLPPPDHHISVTLSPLHLLTLIGEVTAEFRVVDRFSAALIVAGGYPEVLPGLRAPAFELGGQASFYAVGDFQHGMQLGAEVLGVFITVPVGTVSTATGLGVSVAPYLGYKVAGRAGFTFMAQLGPNWTFAVAQSGSQSTSQSQFGLLLNLNVGWSF